MNTEQSNRPRKPRLQCRKCPWKVGTDPREIPGGYCEAKHRALVSTVAEPGVPGPAVPIQMACHEAPVGRELPCVGWLAHQLGPGNSLALRMAVRLGRIDANVQTVGPQHECIEDTLPKNEEDEDDDDQQR